MSDRMTERMTGRRMGYFEIGMSVLTEDTWGFHLPLFSQVVVLDSNPIPDRDVVRYLAFSPLFDLISEQDEYPDYAIVVESKAGQLPVIRAERKA